MIHLSTLLKHYKRQDICEEIVAAARDREVAVKYGDKGFGKRPDVLQHPKDVLEFAKKGATSFHCSEELWRNPLQLDPGMRKQDLDDLRKGWDLILDIDCPWLEYSQIAADLLVHALKYHSIENVGVKFSGNHGFHIAVPFDAFPGRVNVANERTGLIEQQEARVLFPDATRKIAFYLQEKIRKFLASRILEQESIGKIIEKTKKTKSEMTKNGEFDPFAILAIDSVLISSRHLYRMPYSFNEKSGLVSIPIDPKKLAVFDKGWAVPDGVQVEHDFMPKKIVHGEARRLFDEAYALKAKNFIPFVRGELEKKGGLRQKEDFSIPLQAVPEQYFPPCIQRISQGLQDGKKRAMFVLINFLTSLGWNYEQIEVYLREWNKHNPEPLREQLIVGHLRYHQQTKKKALPPNCANKAYMVAMGVCTPDKWCGANTVPGAQDFSPRIKNPVSYALKRQRLNSLTKKKI